MSLFILSPDAQTDVSNIWDYTDATWGEGQAERYVAMIRDACQGLADRKRQGRPADNVRPGYRKMAVGAHVIFFRILDDGTIYVVRVLHERMDVYRHL